MVENREMWVGGPCLEMGVRVGVKGHVKGGALIWGLDDGVLDGVLESRAMIFHSEEAPPLWLFCCVVWSL